MLQTGVVGKVVDALIASNARRATKFLSEKETVRAQRVMFNGRIDKRDKRTTVVVTFGTPNYLERDFIKKLKKAGAPFPVKKIQLKFPKEQS